MNTIYDQKLAEQVQALIKSLDSLIVSISKHADSAHCNCNIYRLGPCAHHAAVRDRIQAAAAYLNLAADELQHA